MEDKENKIIHLCEAACGSGKTHAMIEKIWELLKKGNVLVAAPTINLCEEISAKIYRKDKALPPFLIHSENSKSDGTPVYQRVQDCISNHPLPFGEYARVIITTHDALFKLEPESLKNWVVVIDEVPSLINIFSCRVKKIEFKILKKYYKFNDDRIVGLKEEKRDELDDILSGEFNSTEKQKELADIYFSSLKTDEPIFYTKNKKIDKEKRKKKKSYRYTLHSVQIEKNVLTLFSRARETHILCANLRNTLADLVLKHFGFKFQKSILSPNFTVHHNTGLIKLYPLMSKTDFYSRRRVTDTKGSDGMIINQMLDCVETFFKRDFIYVVNKWTKKSKGVRKIVDDPAKNILGIKYDARGTNDYASYYKVAFIASAFPDPIEAKNLTRLQEITGIPKDDWITAYNISNTYEMAYQAVARTAIRRSDNKRSISVIVPDYKYVDYLKSQFPDCIEETSLIIDLPPKNDGRSDLLNEKKPKILKDIKSKVSRAEIISKYKISPETHTKFKNEAILGDMRDGVSDIDLRQKYKYTHKATLDKLRSILEVE